MNNFRSLIEPFRISDKLTLVLKQRVRLMSRSWKERRKEEHVKEEKKEKEDKGKMVQQEGKKEGKTKQIQVLPGPLRATLLWLDIKRAKKISLKNRKEQKISI